MVANSPDTMKYHLDAKLVEQTFYAAPVMPSHQKGPHKKVPDVYGVAYFFSCQAHFLVFNSNKSVENSNCF